MLGLPSNGYSFLEMLGFSLLIDSLFIASDRNLLMVMLAHQGVSTSFLFVDSGIHTPIGIVALLLMAVGVRVWVAQREGASARVAAP